MKSGAKNSKKKKISEQIQTREKTEPNPAL